MEDSESCTPVHLDVVDSLQVKQTTNVDQLTDNSKITVHNPEVLAQLLSEKEIVVKSPTQDVVAEYNDHNPDSLDESGDSTESEDFESVKISNPKLLALIVSSKETKPPSTVQTPVNTVKDNTKQESRVVQRLHTSQQLARNYQQHMLCETNKGNCESATSQVNCESGSVSNTTINRSDTVESK